MGLIKLYGSFLLVAVFSIAVLSYMIGFANDNDVAVDLSDDPEISTLQTNIGSNIRQIQVESNTSIESFYETEADTGDETSKSGAQFKGGITETFGVLKNILKVGGDKIFGNEDGTTGKTILLTAILSFFGFVLSAYAFKAWFGKNPD